VDTTIDAAHSVADLAALQATLRGEKIEALKQLLLLSRQRLFGQPALGPGSGLDEVYRQAFARFEQAKEALARLTAAPEETP
jgi:hypothetical protein